MNTDLWCPETKRLAGSSVHPVALTQVGHYLCKGHLASAVWSNHVRTST